MLTMCSRHWTAASRPGSPAASRATNTCVAWRPWPWSTAPWGGNRNARFVLSFRKLSSGDPELRQAQLDASEVLSGPVVYRVDLIAGGSATQRPHPTDFRKKLLPLDDRRFLLTDPGKRVVLQRRATQALWARAVTA